ncbi:peptidoglycan-recognition protein LD isoform X2 [Drosophila ananassae]|uniref:peptidoglycan-recognition protein LD isoform X2 n=1 Tax=Drosophila ananassae TaxID=7217 RepID=UPI0013A5DE00|nr:peptidoglycan-recognition protein LD isoform X2 [Drosophila ananassae]
MANGTPKFSLKMPIFVSAYSLRAISKYYEEQDQSGLDKLCHLANHLRTFILAKLHHVLFALYFALLALHHVPSEDSTTPNGSLGSTDHIIICVSEDSEVSESTPLLRTSNSSFITPPPASITKDCLNWRSVGLLAMCASGVSLAIYLLWRQTQLPDFGYRLTLIEHDVWSDMDVQDEGTVLDPLKVVTVFFTQTDSPECQEDCLEVLHELQASRKEELPYNFLITGDCQAFEARGWQYESFFSQELPLASSLVIAFVGQFHRIPPNRCQLKVAQALLLESLKRRKLQPDYQLYVLGSNTGAVERELELWPRYAGHRSIK